MASSTSCATSGNMGGQNTDLASGGGGVKRERRFAYPRSSGSDATISTFIAAIFTLTLRRATLLRATLLRSTPGPPGSTQSHLAPKVFSFLGQVVKAPMRKNACSAQVKVALASLSNAYGLLQRNGGTGWAPELLAPSCFACAETARCGAPRVTCCLVVFDARRYPNRD